MNVSAADHDGPTRPRLLYLAWGFPPAAKSCTFRMLATANAFVAAGWEVTVLTLTEDLWRREQGIDVSLRELVDPRIDVRRIPLERVDLETNIRLYPQDRAEDPPGWLKRYRAGDRETFPELVFGRWHDQLIEACRELAREQDFDLLLTSATPYTFFAPALDLFRRTGLPYVVDYRDAWAIDIIRDRPGFAADSPEAVFESELLAHATEAWFVNEPIRAGYRQIYPEHADRFHIVRNGSDVAVGTDRIPLRLPDAEAGLTFGYLGTVTFDARRMQAILDGWRLARTHSPVLARSVLEFRGHFGTGSARGATVPANMIAAAGGDGVRYEGPVAKAATADVYARWDVLVLALVGGRYVTSGKVFDYISTGLPVLSIHEWDHAAVEILADYPLWTRNDGVAAEDIAEAFVDAADLALSASVEQHRQARRYAERFERYAQIEPAVARLTERFAAGLAPHPPTAAVTVESPASAEPIDLSAERVALVYTTAPSAAVQAAVTRLRSHGARITLIGSPLPEADDIALGVDRHIPVRKAVSTRSEIDGRSPRRYSPAWARLVADNLVRKKALPKIIAARGSAFGWWLAIRRDGDAIAALRDATLLCALNDEAIYTVWEASRVNAFAPAISGIGPLLDHVGLALPD